MYALFILCRKHSRDRHNDEDEEAYKERKYAKKAAKVAKALGYSNDINPFGDSSLLQPFVWGKRAEKKKRDGTIEEDSEEKRVKLMKEIDKVRKRRDEREKEIEEMERLRGEEQRLREALSYGDWEEKEEQFHMEQIKTRSKIRLLDGRERPVDLLAKNMLMIESQEAGLGAATNTNITQSIADENERDIAASLAFLESTDVTDPIVLVMNLSLENLKQLRNDVLNYVELERQKLKQKQYKAPGLDSGQIFDSNSNLCLWENLLKFVDLELQNTGDGQRHNTNANSMHRVIKADVEKLLENKSIRELEIMHKDIEDNIKSGVYGDTEYWGAISREVYRESVLLRVRDAYQSLMKRKKIVMDNIRCSMTDSDSKKLEEQLKTSKRGLGAVCVESADIRKSSMYDNFSEEEVRILQESGAISGIEAADANAEIVDADFSSEDEVALPMKNYSWKDKYTPRKPKYFNRVRTGGIKVAYNMNLIDMNI